MVAMAWTAYLAEPTVERLEVHMDAHVTIEVRGEARGAVGPVGVRSIHASGGTESLMLQSSRK